MSKMLVDIRVRDKVTCTLSLDTSDPKATIEFSGPDAEHFKASAEDGYSYAESGKAVELKLGQDDIIIMTSLYKIMTGRYVRASLPYFEGEQPPQVEP